MCKIRKITMAAAGFECCIKGKWLTVTHHGKLEFDDKPFLVVQMPSGKVQLVTGNLRENTRTIQFQRRNTQLLLLTIKLGGEQNERWS